MGLHVMECAGNSRSAHFGMLSLAAWEGVPLQDIFENALLFMNKYAVRDFFFRKHCGFSCKPSCLSL
jgi:hypothetical protein